MLRCLATFACLDGGDGCQCDLCRMQGQPQLHQRFPRHKAEIEISLTRRGFWDQWCSYSGYVLFLLHDRFSMPGYSLRRPSGLLMHGSHCGRGMGRVSSSGRGVCERRFGRCPGCTEEVV